MMIVVVVANISLCQQVDALVNVMLALDLESLPVSTTMELLK